jgi:hypothetical protein
MTSLATSSAIILSAPSGFAILDLLSLPIWQSAKGLGRYVDELLRADREPLPATMKQDA